MKNHFLTVILILCAWPGVSTAQAPIVDAVGAWGQNSSGQTTVPAAAQSGVVAVGAGGYHTVALKNDGSVVAWGDNGSGQTTVPVAVQGGPTAIAAGAYHTVALKNNGSVVAWGNNYWGQTTMPVAAQSEVTAIAAGGNHTVALKNDGSVVAWGANYSGQTTVPIAAQSGVIAIEAGGDFTVALKNNGSVVAWGDNWYGQTTIPVAAQSGVTAIAAGGDHTVALKTNGTVVAWGWDGWGQTTVPVAAQSGVKAIAAGHNHTVALKTDGTVVAWGANVHGETTVPKGLSGVLAIAAGGGGSASGHTVVLRFIPTVPLITAQPASQTANVGQSASFTVGATGFPLNYQWRKDDVDLGGETSAAYSMPFTQTNHAGSYTVVVSNPAGSVTSAPPAVLTVTEDLPTISTQPVGQAVNEWQSGSLTVIATGSPLYYQWRKDDVDLVGETSPTYGLRFARTNQAGNYTVVVSNPVGSVTSAPPAVLTVNAAVPGTVVAWGDNSSGQTTVPIAAQSGVIAIAAGGDSWGYQADGFGQTVALKNDGTVIAWGIAAPVPSGLSGVTAIAAGIHHTVALKGDGVVVAWGYYSGQTTVPLAAQSDVRAIAAGGGHTVALKNDGTVVAWGHNFAGQVTGTPTSSHLYFAIASPVTLGGQVLTGVTAIAAGFAHTVALKSDGTVVAWGNRSGVWSSGGVMAIAAGGYHIVVLKTDGSVAGGDAPIPLAAQSGVTAITAGGDNYTFHALALKNDGTVVAWGAGTNNTGGDAEYGQSIVPAGLSGVTAIAAGATHSVALLGTVPLMPFLTSRHSGNELILSWSTNAVAFTLQSTPQLTPPLTWADVTNPPAVIGTQWTVTNTFSGSAQFYRLRKL